MDDQRADPPSRPPTIPGYDLLEPIGEGGMGTVYRARQHQPPRAVAVKFLAPLPSHQLTTEAFERETRTMAALNHPNVVTIHDCGQVEGRHYLVMEYVSGSSLRALLEPERPWPIAQAAPVLEAIARALIYIHEQGILHLDLKPENVLLSFSRDPEGSAAPALPSGSRLNEMAVKITDFGLALRRVDARTLSELGLAQGTIDYCSPEQRYGLPIDPRSDLFSLATLAYELLTGHLPGRVFASACARNPELAFSVDDVLRRGLARDPDERYNTVEEFHRDLAAALRHPRSASDSGTVWLVAAGVPPTPPAPGTGEGGRG